jgi:8-oxo-dGTP pyrophosphatase MutT (NUDIX family)
MSDHSIVGAARPAATILLVRDTPAFEVLMVERHAAQRFSSALVFPGGGLAPEDDPGLWATQITGGEGLSAAQQALRIAGFRELFEETGAVVGVPAKREPTTRGPFSQALAAHGLCLDLDALRPFARWVTPEFVPKRFDTHFFLCGLPAVGKIACDQFETVSLEWMSPQAAVDHWAAGTRRVLFPTRLNLTRLAQSANVAEAIAAARARPAVTVISRKAVRPDGVYVWLPEEAGYGPNAEDRIGDAPVVEPIRPNR